jgi:2-octaprenylphenol hydroxylase
LRLINKGKPVRMKHRNYDIAIVGSGIVGAATALALAKHTSLKIAVLEVKSPALSWQADQLEQRVSAIAPSSKRIFEKLNVWSGIAGRRISPYQGMQVWDAAGKGELNFSAQALGEEVLGYIIEDNVIRMSLLEEFNNCNNLDFLFPLTIQSWQENSDHLLLTTDEQTIQTKLLIAADGAESWVRQQAAIELKSWDYQHTALVMTVRTELPHHGVARQRFLSTGPLAFLPLSEPHRSSLVWSVTPDYATHLLSLDDKAFSATLGEAFDNKLGAIISVTSRQSFPLRMRHAKQYVQNRIALIGDAAHTVHPLAGQGVNMGLLDATTLADVIIAAHHKQRDVGSLATLRRYERWRKGDTLAMLATVEALKHLFASQAKPVQYLRNAGLAMTNQLPWLKDFIASYALGKRSDLPSLAQ